MDYRTKLLLYTSLGAAALATAGCGFNQQPRFHMSFLPPAPPAMVVPELSEPPAVEPNHYLKETPSFTNPSPLSSNKIKADRLVDQAEQRFQRGQRFYRVQQFDEARKEFDTAVDNILEAAETNPTERQVYECKLDQLIDSIHHFDLGGLGAAAASEEARFEKAPLEDILQMTFPVDPKLKDRVKEQVASTVSQLPLSVNDAVLGYIHYFSNRGHKTMISGLQRAGRYRPLIRRILDEEGVPQELIHLAQAESGFYPRAMSRAKAGGMWQFLTWRGNQYQLMQTRYTDDRMDPEKATRAAARHLRDLYNEFGDWYLAIAAYNCGPVTIEKAVERTGYADFWELRNRGVIPAETTNYVPIILAMTIMEKNAAEYGLDNITPELPVQYDTIELEANTNLALIADLTDTSVAELQTLNPSVLKSIAPAGHAVHVPKGMGNTLIAGLQQVPTEKRAAWRMHKVVEGDTLASIGKRYGSLPANIVAANHMTSQEAVEGDRLLIPAVLREEPVRTATRTATARRRTTASTARRTAASRSTASRSTSSRTTTSRSTGARTTTTKSAPAKRKSPAILTHTASR